MMFVHNKGFRYDMEPFIYFVRKFLITVGEQSGELIIGYTVVEYAGRKSFQIFLPFPCRFFTTIRGDDHLGDIGIRKLRISSSFSFIKRIKQG